jgi:mRNA turnover protein 4
MPKSKRAKVVTLSKVTKKGKENGLKLFANVRESINKYQYCFVFGVENMRNTYLKELRSEFSLDSRFVLDGSGPLAQSSDARLKLTCSCLIRFIFGKTRVMAKALGTIPDDEYQRNLAQLSKVPTSAMHASVLTAAIYALW